MRITLFGLALTALFSAEVMAEKPRIAIIIDDIGYQKADLKMVSLPYSLTLSVLPHTPYGPKSAQLAFAQQKDVFTYNPPE